ncbi:MAG: GNAT family N-acetyltransferase [Bacteroidales bacterium]|nr:GNAT family N-acetyltransferase [Bacteroidales bacterium]
MNLNKEKYISLCESEPTIPVFSQYWWLDSVCPGEWDVLVLEKNKEIIASWPFHIQKKGIFRLLTMPVLTQNLGPWIKWQENMPEDKRAGYFYKIIDELILLLPKSDLFHFNLHYSYSNWLPFYWNGFSETTKYTYILENLNDPEEVFNRFDPAMRNKVRKAEKVVETVESDDIEMFYEINKRSFERQKLVIPYSFELFRRHDKVLKEKKARRIFIAKDNEGKVHSALYLTWDKMSSYVHMVGEDPELRSSGAGIKLIWDAIKYTKEVLNLDKLDFEGSMIRNIEMVRRHCGGHPVPYFSLTRYNNRLLKLLMMLKNRH